MRVPRGDRSSLEYVRLGGAESVEPHVHHIPHACLVLDGALHDERDGSEDAVLSAGLLRFSPAGSRHRIEPGSDGATCIVFEFAYPVGKPVCGNPVPAPQLARFLRTTARDLLECPSPARQFLLTHQAISAAIRSLANDGALEDDLEALGHARLLETEPASVAGFASMARMHRATFTRRFVRQHGMDPRTYRLLARLERAGNFLRAGMSGARAAAESGFADQSHMTKAWRRLFGGTPVAWAARAGATNVQSRPSRSLHE